jgi:nucleoside-diphosphate-sugar epimerase
MSCTTAQPRRAVSGELAKTLLGWGPTTPLEDGVGKTVAWWLEKRGTMP